MHMTFMFRRYGRYHQCTRIPMEYMGLVIWYYVEYNYRELNVN